MFVLIPDSLLSVSRKLCLTSSRLRGVPTHGALAMVDYQTTYFSLRAAAGAPSRPSLMRSPASALFLPQKDDNAAN